MLGRYIGAALILVVTMLLGVTGNAKPLVVDGISVEIPDEWVVDLQGNDTASVNLAKDKMLLFFSVQVCNRDHRSDCDVRCEATEIRRNYFFFEKDLEDVRFAIEAKDPESVNFNLVGHQGAAATRLEVASFVNCSTKGIVYLGIIERGRSETAENELSRLARSAHWQP